MLVVFTLPALFLILLFSIVCNEDHQNLGVGLCGSQHPLVSAGHKTTSLLT